MRALAALLVSLAAGSVFAAPALPDLNGSGGDWFREERARPLPRKQLPLIVNPQERDMQPPGPRPYWEDQPLHTPPAP
jgi:hypothetical protein